MQSLYTIKIVRKQHCLSFLFRSLFAATTEKVYTYDWTVEIAWFLQDSLILTLIVNWKEKWLYTSYKSLYFHHGENFVFRIHFVFYLHTQYLLAGSEILRGSAEFLGLSRILGHLWHQCKSEEILKSVVGGGVSQNLHMYLAQRYGSPIKICRFSSRIVSQHFLEL